MGRTEHPGDPVGSYPPNGHGLFDTAGNVWEWTADWYTARHPEDADKPCCVPHNPRGGPEQDSIDSAHMSHIGFRCSREPEPPGAMPMWVRP